MDTLLAVVLVCIVGTMVLLFICNVKKPPEDPYEHGKYSFNKEDAGCAVNFRLSFPDSASMDSETSSEFRENGTRSFSRQTTKPDLPPAYIEVIKENKDELPPPYEPMHMWLESSKIKKVQKAVVKLQKTIVFLVSYLSIPNTCSIRGFQMIAWFIDQPYRSWRMTSDSTELAKPMDFSQFIYT